MTKWVTLKVFTPVLAQSRMQVHQRRRALRQRRRHALFATTTSVLTLVGAQPIQGMYHRESFTVLGRQMGQLPMVSPPIPTPSWLVQPVMKHMSVPAQSLLRPQ